MSWDLLTAHGWQGLTLAVWVALSVGSFLNVVIYRLPLMMQREWKDQAREILSDEQDAQPETQNDPAHDQETFNLSVPRSHCVACGHAIRFWENIPILSWLFLRGRCSACAAPISWRYPGVEAITAALTIATLAQFGFTAFGLAACFLTWGLVALTFIDYDTKLLPDQITLPLLWLGLFANGFLGGIVSLEEAVTGAILGYGFLWLTYWGFKLVTGKEGMGYGDFKLLGALGAWLGWMVLPGIILISAISGLLYAGLSFLRRQRAGGESIPFGPFLAFAGWVALIFRDNVLRLFLS